MGSQSKPLTDIAEMPTIGVVGVTIPGAADCVNKINQHCQKHFQDHNHPNIVLSQLNFGPTHRAQNENRWDIVESRLISSIDVLARSGADFAIIPANTVHKVIESVQDKSPIPVLNMLTAVAKECRRLNLKKVAIIGTHWTMANHLYYAPLLEAGIEEVVPSSTDQALIQQSIFSELIPTGKVKQETLNKMLGVVERLKAQGCDGVALACTELPLVLNSENCGITTLDTTAILAEAAIEQVLLLMKPTEAKKLKSKL